MTDREFLVELKSMVDAQLGTVVIPVPPPAPPDPTPPAPPPSGNVDGVFTWESVGEVKHINLQAGQVYCYSNDVPNIAQLLSYEIIPVSAPEKTPDYVHELKMWQSKEPRGPALDDSTYDGPWQTGGLMSVPNALFTPGPAFVNVSVSETGWYGLKQNHS